MRSRSNDRTRPNYPTVASTILDHHVAVFAALLSKANRCAGRPGIRVKLPTYRYLRLTQSPALDTTPTRVKVSKMCTFVLICENASFLSRVTRPMLTPHSVTAPHTLTAVGACQESTRGPGSLIATSEPRFASQKRIGCSVRQLRNCARGIRLIAAYTGNGTDRGLAACRNQQYTSLPVALCDFVGYKP